MSFDPILWSKLSGQQKSGGAGYESPAFPTIRCKSWENEGQDVAEFAGGTYFKVANISDFSELTGATFTCKLVNSDKSESFPLSDDMWFCDTTGTCAFFEPFMLCMASTDCAFVTPDGTSFSAVATSPGLYVSHLPVDHESAYEIVLKAPTVVHTIDPKFIPGAVLPVVELETDLIAETTLSESDCAKLNSAVTSGLPIVAKINFFGGVITETTVLQRVVVIGEDDGLEYLVLTAPAQPLAMIEHVVLSQQGDSWGIEYMASE